MFTAAQSSAERETETEKFKFFFFRDLASAAAKRNLG